MGRPPIGDRAMTDAERQRRRRGRLATKHPRAVAKPEPVTDQTQAGTCYVCERHKLPFTSYGQEIDAIAAQFEIPQRQVDRMHDLTVRSLLWFFAEDAEEAAKWLVRELDFNTCEDLAGALMDRPWEDAEAE